jgi:hypothetical protein
MMQMQFKKVFNHYFFWVLNYYLLPHPTGAFKKIDSIISSLPNVKKDKHLYGSIEWRYKNKPIGHIHGNCIVDILFPKEIQSRLLLDHRVAQNKYAKNGISIHLKANEDIDFAIKILTQSYNLVKSKTDKYGKV